MGFAASLRRAHGAAIVAVLILFGVPRPVAAATYHARDGASLQAAVASANAAPGSSTIELSAGTFLPTSTLTVNGDVTIVGPSVASPAKLDGGSVSPFPSDLLVVGAHARVTMWNVEMTTAGGAGSAAAIDDFGVVDLESSTVAGNSAPGLLVQVGATATVRNSTLSDGLDVGIVDRGTASLFNATVAANANGGVDDAGGTLNLTNTILAKNGSSDCTRRATSSDRSLDGDGSCGVALSRTDPALGRLAANGGPTSTRALSPGSPAIDAGDNSKCPADDQRHFARSDGRCDIGAYEAGAVSGGAPTAPSGARPGGAPSSRAGAGAIIGVSARGTLRGAARSRIAFTVRALVGHARAAFLYHDRGGRIVLRSLTLRSMMIDGRRGVATLRGSCMEMPSRRRVAVTIVLTSHSRHRSLRIRLSNRYFRSGSLLSGSITFTRARARSSQITGGGRGGTMTPDRSWLTRLSPAGSLW
jgi:hypothetical protein